MASRAGGAYAQPNTPLSFTATTDAVVAADDVVATRRIDTVRLDSSILPWRAALRAQAKEHGLRATDDDVTVQATAAAQPIAMRAHHLMQGELNFTWTDKDAVGGVFQPNFRCDDAATSDLTPVQDLSTRDRAAYEALLKQWRVQTQPRSGAASVGSAAGIRPAAAPAPVGLSEADLALQAVLDL